MNKNIADDITKRVPEGWYGLTTPPGWDTIVSDTHMALKAIDPNYEVHQIKEKFGGLRYYCSLDSDPEARKIIDAAEKASYNTCQNCGSTSPEVNTSQNNGHWVTTTCPKCKPSQTQNPT